MCDILNNTVTTAAPWTYLSVRSVVPSMYLQSLVRRIPIRVLSVGEGRRTLPAVHIRFNIRCDVISTC